LSGVQRARAAGGSLHLAAPTAPVRRLITLVRLSDVLPIAASRADVIVALDTARPEMMAQRACPFSGDLAGGGNAMKNLPGRAQPFGRGVLPASPYVPVKTSGRSGRLTLAVAKM
jgi:hypothetical protein